MIFSSSSCNELVTQLLRRLDRPGCDCPIVICFVDCMVGDVNLFISENCREAEIEVMIAGMSLSSTVQFIETRCFIKDQHIL